DVVLSEGGEFIVEYFKWPWQNRNSYVAHSPLTYAERVTTPLLLQHGEADPRVPVSGAWKFYRTLKTMGKNVELEVYPRGGHVLREPMQQREQMRRNLEWFERWIPTAVPGARGSGLGCWCPGAGGGGGGRGLGGGGWGPGGRGRAGS